MASNFSLVVGVILFGVLHMVQQVEAATCSDCFTTSRAVYYPNSDEQGTSTGACGYGSFGATVNGGDVSAASSLYRNGIGCGACYQVKCTDASLCSDNGVTITITDQGSSDGTDFILSRRAFAKLGQTKDAGASLLGKGVVGIQFRRVACSYPGKNMVFKIDESSNFPNYLAFAIWFQEGNQDVAAVQLCETQNLTCNLLDRSRGAVWTVVSPPRGPLKVRMLVNDGEDDVDGGTWVEPANNIPQDWKAGDFYDSGTQLKN